LALCPFLLVLHLLSEAKRLTRSWNVDIENPQIEAAPPLMTPCSLRLCPPGFFDYATNDIILFLFAMCDNMLVCLALNDSQDLMSTVETNHELPNPINVIWRRSHRAVRLIHPHEPISCKWLTLYCLAQNFSQTDRFLDLDSRILILIILMAPQ
jgi:hypothetical protein